MPLCVVFSPFSLERVGSKQGKQTLFETFSSPTFDLIFNIRHCQRGYKLRASREAVVFFEDCFLGGELLSYTHESPA